VARRAGVRSDEPCVPKVMQMAMAGLRLFQRSKQTAIDSFLVSGFSFGEVMVLL
jgi:hypothetical protein